MIILSVLIYNFILLNKLYHEVTIVNLLELVLYNKNACTSVDEKMLDMVDYCARKVTFLNTWYVNK